MSMKKAQKPPKVKPIYDTSRIAEQREDIVAEYVGDADRKKRYAFEWFMRHQDLWYWQQTVEYVNAMYRRLRNGMTAICIAIILMVIVLINK